jgi:acyl carrier protein
MRHALNVFIAREILHEPEREISLSEPLITSGLIDSFHLVDLALFIEERYGVRIEDAELSARVFDTLEQLLLLIAERRSERGA